MAIVVAEHELYRSCRILFGSDLEVGGEFLNYLRPSGLKKAYRLKARQTHPDLQVVNQSRADNGSLPDFLSVQQAYENLRRFLERRDLGFRFTHAAAPSASPGNAQSSQWRSATDHFQQQRSKKSRPEGHGAKTGTAREGGNNRYSQLYCGPMPNIRLRLGNFMYYSGLVDWTTVARALIWQRSQRPRLGELARRLGWLTEEEIWQVLIHREFMEKFGASAVRRQNLTVKQLNTLVAYQKILQKKFGEFFLEQRLFTGAELDELVQRQREHNAACPGTWPG